MSKRNMIIEEVKDALGDAEFSGTTITSEVMDFLESLKDKDDDDDDELDEDGELKIHIQTHVPYIRIRSSNGMLLANLEDGTVIHCAMDEDGEGIDQIRRFNLIEQMQYRNQRLYETESYDILDFGYWTKDGKYEPPADDWREMMKKMAEEG